MGQSISDLPPHHYPGEHFLLYDANAWRHLSQTYLDQIQNGKLTKAELELIELEQYWHRRHQYRKRPYSLSPAVRRKYRSRTNLLHSPSLSSFNADNNFLKRPAWKNLADSSHLTKNNKYHYHSLANLTNIHPTKDQIQNWASNLNDSKKEYYNQRSIQQKSCTPKLSNSNLNPAINSSCTSFNLNNPISSLTTKRIDPLSKEVLRLNDLDNLTINFKKPPNFNDANYAKLDFDKINSGKKFKEYSSKQRLMEKDQVDHKVDLTHVKLSRQANLSVDDFKNGDKSLPKRNYNSDEFGIKRNFAKAPSDSSSSPISFHQTESTRTSQQQSFIADIDQPEQLVHHSFGSFHKKQKNSTAPKFRINSKEKLWNNDNKNTRHHVQFTTNKNHCNDYIYDYDENDEDNQFVGPRRHGSGQLMRSRPKSRFSKCNEVDAIFNDQKYIPYNGYYLDVKHPQFSQYYQNFDRPYIGFTKILYIVLLFFNVGVVIWSSIYMHFSAIKIKLGEPINGNFFNDLIYLTY